MTAPDQAPMPQRTGAFAVAIERMKKRRDFVALSRANRQAMPGMIVQARLRDNDTLVRVGFTCSKKVGNAVARNRAKRRLREAARLVLPEVARPGWDYVLIGRRDVTAERRFEDLKSDLARALARLHQ